MNIGQVTTGAVATAVWGNATRQLTGFGTALTIASAGSTTLAAASSVDLVQAANTIADLSMTVKTGTSPTGNITINIWDGTTVFQVAITTLSTGATASANIRCGSFVRARLTNADAAVAGTYIYGGMLWSK